MALHGIIVINKGTRMLYIQNIECMCKHKNSVTQNCSGVFLLLKMVILCHWQNQRLGLKISCGKDVHLFSDSLCNCYIKLECNSTKLLALFFQDINSLGMRLISHCFALFVVMQIVVQDVRSGDKMLPFCCDTCIKYSQSQNHYIWNDKNIYLCGDCNWFKWGFLKNWSFRSHDTWDI